MLKFIHLNKFKFPSHPWAVTTVSPVNTANTALWAEPVVEQREFAVSCTPGSGDFTKTNEKSNYQSNYASGILDVNTIQMFVTISSSAVQWGGIDRVPEPTYGIQQCCHSNKVQLFALLGALLGSAAQCKLLLLHIFYIQPNVTWQFLH